MDMKIKVEVNGLVYDSSNPKESVQNSVSR